MNILLETSLSILNLLNSDVTSERISQESKININKIDDLRENKIKLNNLTFRETEKLYNLSVNLKLDNKYLESLKSKGKHSSVKINMPVEKLFVSRYDLGLFSLGKFFDINTVFKLKSNSGDLEPVYNITSALISESKENIYPNFAKNLSFLTGYEGGSPRRLADYIEKYSNISRQDIENIIFSKNLIEYDFESDELIGYDNPFVECNNGVESEFLNLYRYNNKLIFKIKGFKVNENYNLNENTDRILKICNVMQEYYSSNLDLKEIRYIKNFTLEETKKYKFNNVYNNIYDYVNLVFVFNEFEIWIPTKIHEENVFNKKEMREFLETLNLTVIDKNLLEKGIKKLDQIINGVGIEKYIEILRIE
ncbi:hypothetical protein [Clostridium perfringens]|uniref:Uncharacterized protein n=1 Tax=Clostridium perfringens TaxID=1502 RepID=A0A2X2Y329_CLOPF|nr:hypothetical protein [Clostridium perfringens]WEV20279.1 hypothetical protein PL323_06480 [Clostridium perfringens D]SQB58077.1 Uncharacterised protein [Clostridium perfringens]